MTSTLSLTWSYRRSNAPLSLLFTGKFLKIVLEEPGRVRSHDVPLRYSLSRSNRVCHNRDASWVEALSVGGDPSHCSGNIPHTAVGQGCPCQLVFPLDDKHRDAKNINKYQANLTPSFSIYIPKLGSHVCMISHGGEFVLLHHTRAVKTSPLMSPFVFLFT